LTHITAKYDGYCADCRKPVARNGPAVFDWSRKATLCTACGEVDDKPAIPVTMAIEKSGARVPAIR
jgi:hypothetical protein